MKGKAEEEEEVLMPNANVIRERHDQIFYHFIFTLRDGLGGLGGVGGCAG
jgi:hypothetical protein